MPKNILIINSSPDKNSPLIDLLEELSGAGHSFCLASKPSGLTEQFQKNNWPVKKTYLGPGLNKKFGQIIFIFLLPFLFLASLIRLAYYKFNKKISAIICLNINEKIIFAPAAKLLKIKTVWLEDSDSVFLKEGAVNKFLVLICGICSRRADIITFTDFVKAKLKDSGFKEKNITIIRPGIKLKRYEHQDNLFNELANADGKNYRRKFFTVGTAVELNKNQNVEILFQAAKICLNVIPNIQLIIVGEGEERKNLAWLAKKMEIDAMVWFVGEQNHLKKWLDSFDVFVGSSLSPRWIDFTVTLQAMAAELPIAGVIADGIPTPPESSGVKRQERGEAAVPRPIVADGIQNALNAETLAGQIIKLYKDKNTRLKLGRENKETVEKYFTIDRMMEEFKKIL